MDPGEIILHVGVNTTVFSVKPLWTIVCSPEIACRSTPVIENVMSVEHGEFERPRAEIIHSANKQFVACSGFLVNHMLTTIKQTRVMKGDTCLFK